MYKLPAGKNKLILRSKAHDFTHSVDWAKDVGKRRDRDGGTDLFAYFKVLFAHPNFEHFHSTTASRYLSTP